METTQGKRLCTMAFIFSYIYMNYIYEFHIYIYELPLQPKDRHIGIYKRNGEFRVLLDFSSMFI